MKRGDGRPWLIIIRLTFFLCLFPCFFLYWEREEWSTREHSDLFTRPKRRFFTSIFPSSSLSLSSFFLSLLSLFESEHKKLIDIYLEREREEGDRKKHICKYLFLFFFLRFFFLFWQGTPVDHVTHFMTGELRKFYRVFFSFWPEHALTLKLNFLTLSLLKRGFSHFLPLSLLSLFLRCDGILSRILGL